MGAASTQEEPMVPMDAALEFVRAQIADQRHAAAKLARAALTFGVVRADDGRTAWRTIYLDGPDVRLDPRAVPIEYDGRLVTIFTSELELSEVSRGRAAREVDVEGDTEVLEIVSRCFASGMDLYTLRAGR